jgi:hypothetical protein
MIGTHSPIGNVIVAQTVQGKRPGFSALTFRHDARIRMRGFDSLVFGRGIRAVRKNCA